jgi:O-antigen ligase
MRSRPAYQTPATATRVLEVMFLFLPFLALVPNFFIIPDLATGGLSTQEFVYTLAATLLAGMGVVALLRAPNTVQVSRFEMWLLGPLLLFLAWQAVSLLWTPDKSEGIRILTIWSGFAVFLGVGLLVAGRRAAMLIPLSLSAVILILAISQFYEYFQYGGEMFGVFFSHGITSELLALLIPLQVVISLSSKELWRMALAFGSAASGTAALILTFRRGPVLGLFMALCFLLVVIISHWIDWKKSSLTLAVMIMVLVGGPVGYYKRHQIVARLRGAVELQRSTRSEATELGLTSRLAIWAVGWETAKHNALVGTGNGGFQSEYGPERKHVVDNPAYRHILEAASAEDFDEVRSPMAHNEYLQVFAELGTIGLALFALFWGALLCLLWKQRKQSREGNPIVFGTLAGLVAFGVSSAVSGFSFRTTPGPLLVACLLTAAFAATREIIAGQAHVKGTKRGHDKRSPARSDNIAEPAPGFRLPKRAAIGAASVVVVLCALSAWRASNVLASQQAQSQIDFRFSKESVPFNEGLVERYQRALDLDPWNAGAHLGYGLLLYQMKRIDESIPHVEFANRHGYSRPLAYLLLAFDYEQAHRLNDASQLLARCLQSFPQSIVTRAAYMALLQKDGHDDLAAEQQRLLESSDRQTGRSWELALRMKDSVATNEAVRLGLIPPGKLSPMIARALVQARAYHYLN